LTILEGAFILQTLCSTVEHNVHEGADIIASMQDQTSVFGWYLIFCKPHQELTAERNLMAQGYQIYLPRATQERRRAGRWIETIEPLFPRYLFINLSSSTDLWSPIRSTRGVASLVRFGDEPARVPDGLVETLIGRENASGLHQIEDKKMKVGDVVRVRTGAMIGYEGIFLARNSRDRVVVLLNIVEKNVRVSMAPDALELVV